MKKLLALCFCCWFWFLCFVSLSQVSGLRSLSAGLNGGL